MCYFADFSTDFVILVVVFSVLDVVGGHDQSVSVALVLFPIEKVDLFEQFLLMMLEFSDHIGGLDVSIDERWR